MESGRTVARWGRAWLIVGLTTAVLTCRFEQAPPAADRAGAAVESDTTTVLAELRSYYRDFSARAWPAFADHFWPGATITTIWQPPGEDSARVVATSVPDFVAQAPAGPGSREVFEERMLGARMRVVGALAQAWVRYRAQFGDPGDVRTWEGIDAFTLLRHRGRWRITSLAFLSGDGGPDGAE